MNDFHAVKICNSFQGLFDDKDGIPLGESPIVTDSFKQFASSGQFGDNVKVLRALEPFVESNNMGVIESFEEVHFLVDHMLVTFDILLRDDFDCYRTIGSFCLLNYSISILR